MAAIRTEGLTKRYGRTEALHSLDLELDDGELVGYLGPNGAGKTTTMRLLLALVAPTAGRAEIFGIDCQAHPVEAHRRLAYVPGETSLWPSLTGGETAPPPVRDTTALRARVAWRRAAACRTVRPPAPRTPHRSAPARAHRLRA